MQNSAQQLKRCSPAVKRLLTALSPHLQELQTGRLHSRLVGKFCKGFKSGRFSYAPLHGVELQKAYPLDRLLKSGVSITQPGYSLVVQVPIKPALVQRQSSLASDFYLEAVVVCGDPFSDAPLRVESTVSTLYAFDAIPSITCTLHLPIISNPWILFLKFCSLEGNELAVHPKHYGMQVIEVGS
jgi:hypothetical protein